MSGKLILNWRRWGLRAIAALLGVAALAGQFTAPVTAGSGDRTLYLYHTHTHETGRFTFKHNGQYDENVLKQMNVFLADWRTKEPTHMSPQLFDLLWEIYQEVGATQPINIVSAYRSPKTNAMLRATSSGVAENSQHMLGKAMDVYIPGISLTKLRETAMRHQVGGVGYYPTSGSPFVHVDVGNVRAWPRMTRAQLKKVFPDGKTLHLPTDGTPLSVSGRQYAMAQWSKCHEVPCGTSILPAINESPEIQVASLDPAERSVPVIDFVAPVAKLRPSDAGDALAQLTPLTPPAAIDFDPNAPLPALKSPAMMLATRDPLPGEPGGFTSPGSSGTALAALAALGAPIPQERLTTDDVMMTAYAPEIVPNADAQRALEMLIERETSASIAATPVAPKSTASQLPAEIRTASLSAPASLEALKNVFDMTWSAVSAAGDRSAKSSNLAALVPMTRDIPGLKRHEVTLVAPEIDHVDETMTMPSLVSSGEFAAFYEPEGYLDQSAELGSMAPRVGLERDDVAPPGYDRFVPAAPMLVAAR